MLPNGITGLRDITPYRLAPDAGMCFGNINIEDLLATGFADAIDPANTWVTPGGVTVLPRALGATVGGTVVDPKFTRSRTQIDDVRMPLIGLDRTDDCEPMITLNLIELADLETMKMAIGPCSEETPSASGYIEVRPRIEIEDSDYIGNIAIATSTTIRDGAGVLEERPLIIVLENCIALQPPQWKTNPKGIVICSVQLRASQTVALATTVPLRYFLPESSAA